MLGKTYYNNCSLSRKSSKKKKEIEKQTEIMASECAQKHLIDQNNKLKYSFSR